MLQVHCCCHIFILLQNLTPISSLFHSRQKPFERFLTISDGRWWLGQELWEIEWQQKPQILGFGQFGLRTMPSTFRFWGLTILWEKLQRGGYSLLVDHRRQQKNIQQCHVFFIGWYCSRAIVRNRILRLDRLWENCSRQGIYPCICKQTFSEIHCCSLCCSQDFIIVCFVGAKISQLFVLL